METKNIILPKGQPYTGYLWYSNEQTPCIYINKVLELDIDSSQTPDLPFIVEGYLCTKEDSYSIKMTDGKYYIRHYHLTDYHFTKDEKGTIQASDSCSVTAYLPNRFDSEKRIEKLLFARLWKEEEDPLCEGMSVLVPQDEIFIGFKLKDNQEE